MWSCVLAFLQKKETDQKSVSFVCVPQGGLFSEPFLRDLDLIWRVDLSGVCNNDHYTAFSWAGTKDLDIDGSLFLAEDHVIDGIIFKNGELSLV